MTDAAAIAEALRDIASALALRGDGRFRVKAYQRAAETVAAVGEGLGARIEEGSLGELPAVGPKIAAVIAELHAGGRSALLERLSAELPAGALALARGPKLSMRALRTLSDANIRDVPTLELAAREGRLRSLRGFTAKTEARILRELSARRARYGQMVLRDALDLAADLEMFLRDGDLRLDVVGEVRRGLEIVAAVELLASGRGAGAALERFERYPAILVVESRSEDRVVAVVNGGVHLVVHAASAEARAAALQRLTGSEAHNAAFDAAAARVGLAVETSGAYATSGAGREAVVFDSEEALYVRAGIEWIPPALRDGEDELARPVPRLVEEADLRGMIHCHTDYSDGRHTIEQMARAAMARGMGYITITDHSPTAHYAGGVELDRLKEQWEEIARVQEQVPIRILRGTESDILEDGALDYPDEILEQLDVIVASIHRRHHLDAAAMTRRIVTALRHPLFKIWGHPLGRLLLHRPPVECDVDEILSVAATSRVAIELNGDPYRMDLEPRWARRGRALGIPFVVSVDAHSTHDFDHLATGIVLAQRAGLAAHEVLNTREAEDFVAAVRPRSSLGIVHGPR